MTTRSNMKMAAAALLATAALAGCGGSDDPEPVAPGAAAPTSTSGGQTAATTNADPQQVSWAKQLCTAIASENKPITPPDVNGSSPDGTQKSLVTFFGSVVDQLGGQIETIEKVGPPPGASAKSEWEDATKELRKVRKDVAKLVRNIKAENPKNAKDVQSLLTNLGKQMSALSSYQGPIAELSKSKELGAALAAEPTCASASTTTS